jgi:Domain of unknown function (DUF1906)
MPRIQQIAFRLVVLAIVTASLSMTASITAVAASPSFLGFDRNEYPGDENLKELQKTFSFTGYWLNNPPGTQSNSWAGKRSKLETEGFGFLVLFNGRVYRDLKKDAAEIGKSDGQSAVAAAKREGFPPRTVIFLDQEEGGRLLSEQKAYLFAWIDEVARGGFRAGVYCSGIAVRESGGATITTARDIRESAGARSIAYWVTNDSCPPSPGCAAASGLASPRVSGIDFADVWQFAQSPRRKDVAAGCHGYDENGSCYASPTSTKQNLYVDLNVAYSPDPSGGRTK